VKGAVDLLLKVDRGFVHVQSEDGQKQAVYAAEDALHGTKEQSSVDKSSAPDPTQRVHILFKAVAPKQGDKHSAACTYIAHHLYKVVHHSLQMVGEFLADPCWAAVAEIVPAYEA
jgi:hypothetical protein